MTKSETFKIDFAKPILKFQKEISYIEEYINFNIEKLSERKKALDEMLTQDIDEAPESKSTIEELYFEDQVVLPSFFFHSTIVSLFSLVENNLNEICETIIKETNFVFDLDELADRNIIKKARLFLTKVAVVDFSKIDTAWIEITLFQKLRNLIVHNNSHLKKEKVHPQVIRLINYHGHIEADGINSPFFISDEKVILKFLSTIREFISGVFEQLKELEFQKFQKGENFYKDDWLWDLPF